MNVGITWLVELYCKVSIRLKPQHSNLYLGGKV